MKYIPVIVLVALCLACRVTISSPATPTMPHIPTLVPTATVLVAQIAKPAPTATNAPECIVTASDGNGGGELWLRSTPGGARLTTLKRGDVVTFVYRQRDGWIFTGAGWVYGDYVECH